MTLNTDRINMELTNGGILTYLAKPLHNLLTVRGVCGRCRNSNGRSERTVCLSTLRNFDHPQKTNRELERVPQFKSY